MQCHEFEQRLNDLLDNRQWPEADLLLGAHAAHCQRCRLLLSGQAALFSTLSQGITSAPDHGFAGRIVAEVVARPVVGAARRVWLSLAACLALAAAILLALSLAWSGPSGGTRFEGHWTQGDVTGQPSPGRREWGRSGRRQLTAADLLVEAPRLPEHLRGYGMAMNDLGVTLPEAALRLDEVERLTPGIRPLRVSLFMIWDTLCRAIPGTRVDSSEPAREGTSLWWHESAWAV